MRKIVLGFVGFLAFSCTSKVTKEDIAKLNGYWEIQQVKTATGEAKDYKVNETIDAGRTHQGPFAGDAEIHVMPSVSV